MNESIEVATDRVGALLLLSALSAVGSGMLLLLFISSVPDTVKLPWYGAVLQSRHGLVEGQFGALLTVFGLLALMLWDLSEVCHPKRLAYGFALLHFTLFALPAWQLTDLQAWSVHSPWVVGTVTQLLFAGGFLREALKAPEPEEREEASARQGTRWSWLRLPSDAGREERRRLARDLHDSIKQQIFSVKMSAAAAEARWESDPAGARTALADIRRSAQAAMIEMQALLRQLRPEAVLMEGLVEALREQCEALEFRSGAQVQFELGDLPSEEKLQPRVKEQLFRIAQEALSNVARHARARQVHLWLGTTEVPEGSFLVLRVRDDGQGFDPAAPVNGMGLRNIRERVGALPGHLVLESAPGEGTELRIYLSLRAAEVDAPGASEFKRAIQNPRSAGTAFVLIPFFAKEYPSFSPVVIALILALTFLGWRLPAGSDPTLVRRLAEVRRVHIAFTLTIVSWWGFLVSPWRGALEGAGMSLVAAALAGWVTWSVFRQFRMAFGPARQGVVASLFAILLACSLATLTWSLVGPDRPFNTLSLIVIGLLYYAWWGWTSRFWKERFAKP